MSAPQVQAQPQHSTHYVSFTSEIDQTTSESLLGLCAQLANQKVETVYLLLSTPGGQVDVGITVYHTLRALPSKLITHNTGSVNSIGNVVFLAGEERYTNPHATFVFHGVGFQLPAAMQFEQKDLRARLDSIVADQAKIGAIIAGRTSLDPAEVDELFLEAGTGDPDYARSKGIVHDIREAKVPSGAPIHQLVFNR